MAQIYYIPCNGNRKVNPIKQFPHKQPNISYTVEGGELGRWCELGQNFSDLSPLLLLVKGHWCAMGRKFSALRLRVTAYLTTIATVAIH